ncbi:hypothetical protein [Peptoniphilus sp. DNF00840]|uniref:hypothetical protein n=1 Tax=Peptoniphilus sp. DNF00840 TaxID=1477000 RepID=UPI000781CB7E|nr:hypothetical protein [Peptoniphilus sp. DNF00840]KXB68518.1 hypothetical protein HMPREF1864_01665 [Peptoniphilus sp. DNF00840]
MIKKIIFYLSLFFLVLLSGCSFLANQGTNVKRPEIGQAPIYGKWTITKFISNKKGNQDNFRFKDIIGEDLYFSNNSVLLANDYIKDASYKTKYVKLSDYLYEKFNLDYKNLGVEDSDVFTTYVFDSNSNSSLYYEVIKTSENTALLFDNGITLEIKLVDDKIDNEDLNSTILARKDEVLAKSNLFDLNGDKGFLIGFKTKVDSDIPSWNYKTLYLKFSDLKLENVYEMNNIILPRDDRFFEVSVQRESKAEETTDRLIAKEYKTSNLLNKDPEIPKIETEELRDDNSLKTINFITNNYINVESLDRNTNEKCLRIYNLDNLEDKKALSFKDFISEDALESEGKNIEALKEDPYNIGIYRDNGFWKLKGRVNSENGSFSDFDLNLVLPYEVNKYNKINIPMAQIKNFKSSIKDGFVSPDNNFLITLENNYLKIYNISEGKILPNPIFEREIGEEASTIMTEWATGRYANIWQDELSSNK